MLGIAFPFGDAGVLGLAAVLTLLAVAGKLIGGGIGAWGAAICYPPSRSAALVGRQGPHVEVGLIIAGVGRGRVGSRTPSFRPLTSSVRGWSRGARKDKLVPLEWADPSSARS